MNIEQLQESLSPIERQILEKITQNHNIDELTDEEHDKTTVTRAVTYLEQKKLISTESLEKTMLDLGVLGINYTKKELPERALINALAEQESIPLGEVKNVCKLNDNEAKVAIGTLKKKALLEIKDGRLKLSANRDEVAKKFLEEQLIETLPRELNSLEPQEKLALEALQKRKEIIEIQEIKETTVSITDLGKELKEKGMPDDLIEQVTPKIIKTMGWKGKKFRRYDINAPVSKLSGGKRHFVNQATDYAKSVWLEMGFKEMTGTKTLTGFYNFDALFTAQDHPVREMQDTFYIKDIEGKTPEDKKKVQEIKKAHEGGCDGSLGWIQEWSEDHARRVLLRTHTTPLSIQTLHKIAENKSYPAKYFALGKCFRNETIDWSHGFEFNQTEGIVVDENANFRQLLGYLLQFFNKMGYDKVRVRPAYFPYTEPSLEIDVFHPVHNKWMELGGAGMFRPEVTIPIFGRHIPVLAWGPGFDRLIMEFFNITDLCKMYKNDITKLREMKFWSK